VTTPDLVGLFVEPLERIGIPYMITGGVASVIYGDPRFTRDIDIVLVLDRAGVQNLRAAFEGEDFYVPPEEAMEREVERAAPLEYVILRKLQYYRSSQSDRHLRDISMMLRISGDTLDQERLEGWLSRLDLADTYLQAHRYSPG
jgi:hypothetical protein